MGSINRRDPRQQNVGQRYYNPNNINTSNRMFVPGVRSPERTSIHPFVDKSLDKLNQVQSTMEQFSSNTQKTLEEITRQNRNLQANIERMRHVTDQIPQFTRQITGSFNNNKDYLDFIENQRMTKYNLQRTLNDAVSRGRISAIMADREIAMLDEELKRERQKYKQLSTKQEKSKSSPIISKTSSRLQQPMSNMKVGGQWNNYQKLPIYTKDTVRHELTEDYEKIWTENDPNSSMRRDIRSNL